MWTKIGFAFLEQALLHIRGDVIPSASWITFEERARGVNAGRLRQWIIALGQGYWPEPGQVMSPWGLTAGAFLRLPCKFGEFVTRGGKEQESGALICYVYSLPCWTKFTAHFFKHIYLVNRNLWPRTELSLYTSQLKWIFFHKKHLFPLNLSKTYLESSRVQLVHILHSNLWEWWFQGPQHYENLFCGVSGFTPSMGSTLHRMCSSHRTFGRQPF